MTNTNGIKVRDSIMHCGREFTITNINVVESSEGMKLYIEAVDLQMANKQETQKNEMEDISQKMFGMFKKMIGGEFPGSSPFGG